MNDLFEREQEIFNAAEKRLREIRAGQPCDDREYASLVAEYGRILRQLRRLTRLSDKTAEGLNATRLALLDEVRYDAMTGIYNRRYLEETLRKIIKTLSRVGANLSLMMLDVDFFKRYNDVYGHVMGDECLKAVARALKNGLTRDDDFVARYGGEEFAVILPNTDEQGVATVAERLMKNVRAAAIPHMKNDAADWVTISIGATSSRVRPDSADLDFIQKADEALYLAKQNGRDRYSFLPLEGEQND